MTVKTIGIIGNGVVGHATARCFMEHAEVRCWDKVPERRTVEDFEDVMRSDLIFVCVPETSLYSLIAGDQSWFTNTNIVIKSTCPIGTTRRLAEKYGLKNVVHSPEFLTSRCAVTDAMCPARNIIGMTDPNFKGGDYTVDDFREEWEDSCGEVLATLYQKRFPGVPIHLMTSDESEAVKLFQNAFFAVKVSFWNEMRTLADKLGLDWERVMAGILADGRIAHSHTSVPGPDGRRGWGGACLPKDLQTLIDAYKPEEGDGIHACILKAAKLRNDCLDRKDR